MRALLRRENHGALQEDIPQRGTENPMPSL
jgi:hypothetical protein